MNEDILKEIAMLKDEIAKISSKLDEFKNSYGHDKDIVKDILESIDATVIIINQKLT